ncbi:hypothetical protein EOM39_00495 [Candidatus Gracilibacteria bacterium]|nr:hypothetical protein [Candidatus Gracilibacteria bacterium]
MKKILLLIITFLAFFVFQSTYAETIKVKIPINLSSVISTCGSEPTDGSYECSITTGFSSVKEGLGQIVKYLTFMTGLAGVLYIIINGIMLSMAGLDQNMEKSAKDNIKKTLIGLIILLLSGLILNFIAPWIYV